jgi:hypothetical protein
MDNVISLPILLQDGRCGVHASSHGNATWAVAARDAWATGAVDWDAAASRKAGGWRTRTMEARGRRGDGGQRMGKEIGGGNNAGVERVGAEITLPLSTRGNTGQPWFRLETLICTGPFKILRVFTVLSCLFCVVFASVDEHRLSYM